MTDKQQPHSVPLFQAYKNAWPLFWKVAVGGLLLLLVLSFVVPTSWTASTTVLPPDDKEAGSSLSSLLQGSPITLGGIGGSGSKTSLLFVEILQSRTLLEGVIDTLKLMEHPLFSGETKLEVVEHLSKCISIDNKRTGTVTLSVNVSSKWLPFLNGTSELARQTSAQVANTCTQILDVLNKTKNTSRARGTRQYIERVMEQNKAIIDSLQQKKLAFQEEHKLLSLDEQMAALVENAVTVGTELATAEIELTLVRQEFASTSPQVELLERKVVALRDQYNKVQQGGITGTDGFAIRFSQIPLLTKEYGNLLRDLKIKEQINAFLETQRMEQVIQEAKDIPTVVVMDNAIPPRVKTSPRLMVLFSVFLLILTTVFAVGVPLRTSLMRLKVPN